jgi:hypothetical protein
MLIEANMILTGWYIHVNKYHLAIRVDGFVYLRYGLANDCQISNDCQMVSIDTIKSIGW